MWDDNCIQSKINQFCHEKVSCLFTFFVSFIWARGQTIKVFAFCQSIANTRGNCL